MKRQVRTVHNSDLCVIPGGCTSKLQPADVSWNRPFKSKLAELYNEWIFNRPVEKTKFGNHHAPNRALVLRWIKQAWDCITPDMIRRSFKKCGITCALDGTEDNLFQLSDSKDDGEIVTGVQASLRGLVRMNLIFPARFIKTLSVLCQKSCVAVVQTVRRRVMTRTAIALDIKWAA